MLNRVGKHQWAIPHEDSWAVKGDGDDWLTRITRTQQEANRLTLDSADGAYRAIFDDKFDDWIVMSAAWNMCGEDHKL